MVIFIPKSITAKLRIVQFANMEATADNVAGYAFVGGVMSVFSDKTTRVSQENTDIIATELAHLIQGKSIKDESGSPKNAICSQVALRVMRAGIIVSRLNPSDLTEYAKYDFKKLTLTLSNELIKAESPLADIYASSHIFKREASSETLPYELYDALIKDADLHWRPPLSAPT